MVPSSTASPAAYGLCAVLSCFCGAGRLAGGSRSQARLAEHPRQRAAALRHGRHLLLDARGAAHVSREPETQAKWNEGESLLCRGNKRPASVMERNAFAFRPAREAAPLRARGTLLLPVARQPRPGAHGSSVGDSSDDQIGEKGERAGIAFRSIGCRSVKSAFGCGVRRQAVIRATPLLLARPLRAGKRSGVKTY